MKFNAPMLVVADMEKTLAFYKNVLGLRVILDFGANKTLTGGFSLQTAESYKAFIEKDAIFFGGNDFELYFEEDDLDAFIKKLESCKVEYVHPVKEHSWGQRAVRLYDPDHHIVEVGESLFSLFRRFLENGMTPEQIAARMDVPMKLVRGWMRTLERQTKA